MIGHTESDTAGATAGTATSTTPRASVDDAYAPVQTGISTRLRLIYIPLGWSIPLVLGLDPNTVYRVRLFNTRSGDVLTLEAVVAAESPGNGLQDTLELLEAL